MTVLLMVIAVIVVCWVVATVASVWLLARRNRVTPGARTGAPLHWLAAPSRAATAHRRLRRAVSGARAALGGMPDDAPVRGDVAASVALLERQAVDLDHRLVVAANCPPATRWRLVNDLEPQVREVERIGSELAEVALVASPQPTSARDGLDVLTARLRALADARVELEDMDCAAPGRGDGGATRNATGDGAAAQGPAGDGAGAPEAPGVAGARAPELPPGGVQVPGPAGHVQARQPVARRRRQPEA